MDKAAVKLAPSILAADFARLGEQVAEAEQAGADRIHVDVMDGHFVANISMGAPIVASLRRVTRLHLETHLMISAPDFLLEECVEAEVRFVSRALGRQRQFAPHRTTHQGTGANGLGWSSPRPPRRSARASSLPRPPWATVSPTRRRSRAASTRPAR